MKRALLVGLALGFGLALVSMPRPAQASQPAGEFALMMRLNGSPVYLGHSAAGADGGTVGRVDGGYGNIVKTQCYAAACVCPGTACACGGVLTSINVAGTGELLVANAVTFMQLEANNAMVSVAAASGSLLIDGGSGVDCDHWKL